MLYCMATDKLNENNPAYAPLLSAVRRQKLAALKNPQQRRASLAAELLLCYALHLEAPGQPLPPAYTLQKGGKPVPVGAGPAFSLSHSGRYTVCLLADRPVGVDMQRQTAAGGEAALQRGLTPLQTSLLQELPPARRRARLFDWWTLREAAVKCAGSGDLRRPVAFEPVAENGRLLYRLGEWRLANYDSLPGYSLGVCTAGALPNRVLIVSVGELDRRLLG